MEDQRGVGTSAALRCTGSALRWLVLNDPSMQSSRFRNEHQKQRESMKAEYCGLFEEVDVTSVTQRLVIFTCHNLSQPIPSRK